MATTRRIASNGERRSPLGPVNAANNYLLSLSELVARHRCECESLNLAVRRSWEEALALALELGLADATFADDVTTAKNTADCEKAGGTCTMAGVSTSL